MCDAGRFWNPATEECAQKGGWGYECGFFPVKLQDDACQDGLVCKAVGKPAHGGAGDADGYDHKGAVPASCQECKGEECPHADGGRRCEKTVKLSGKACAEVRVEAGTGGGETKEACVSVAQVRDELCLVSQDSALVKRLCLEVSEKLDNATAGEIVKKGLEMAVAKATSDARTAAEGDATTTALETTEATTVTKTTTEATTMTTSAAPEASQATSSPTTTGSSSSSSSSPPAATTATSNTASTVAAPQSIATTALPVTTVPLASPATTPLPGVKIPAGDHSAGYP